MSREFDIVDIVGPDGEFTPKVQELLDSSKNLSQTIEQHSKLRDKKEQHMLLLMEQLESVDRPGTPRLYVTIGQGRDRVVMSTIPFITVEDYKPKDETFALLYRLNQPPTPRFNVNVQYPVVSKHGFLVLTDAGLLDESMDETDIQTLQDPFNNGQKTRLNYPALLRENCLDGKLLSVEVKYEDIGEGVVYGELLFGSPTWDQTDDRFKVRYRHTLAPIKPEKGVEMLRETQEIYQARLEKRVSGEQQLVSAADQLVDWESAEKAKREDIPPQRLILEKVEIEVANPLKVIKGFIDRRKRK